MITLRAERDAAAAAAGAVVAYSEGTTAKSMWTPEVIFLSMCINVLPPGVSLSTRCSTCCRLSSNTDV